MSLSSSPRYRRFSRAGPAPAFVEELPAYTGRRRATLSQPVVRRDPVEHVFPLEDKGRPWATLTLRSSAKSAKSIPTFHEKENINGSFRMMAEKGDSIHSITVQITGRVITDSSSAGMSVFLSQSLPLWSKIDSRIAGASSKLLGQCEFPFSIPLSKTVNGDGYDSAFRIPETFLERRTQASITYEIAVVVSRGKLRSDSYVKTRFGYIPNLRPDPPSLLRRLAYQENSVLAGPDVDPEGWSVTGPAVVRGLMFRSHPVAVNCILALANPMSYTRGTVLPCRLTVECADAQALELLSASNAPVAVLRRIVRFQSATSKKCVESVEDVSQAVWWPSPSEADSGLPYSRCLEGEIKLSKNLASSSSIGGRFNVSYTVSLLPFDVIGFTPSTPGSALDQPVTIATTYARDSPRPQAYAPPSYDGITGKEPEVEYTAKLTRGLR
ncbi:unnamed protein product [Mycena citricolor]|uniref:Arrestin-like N-terminal domain-containing protein n=1 Tax=Mycena citricolor TaxID=2018698 RepID=A0AAD2Q2C2_9AGAR|nr:unnamed protein product [Mycena citricolor]